MDPLLAGIKKPLSAYMLFNQARNPVIKKENPEMKLVEISKVIGQEWGHLSDSQKAHYIKKAEEAKLDY